MAMGRKQILARAIGIKKKKRERKLSNPISKKAVKYRTMYGEFIPNYL